MRGPTARIACIVLALAALCGCSTIASLLPGHQKTTSLSSLRVAAPPGANLNSAVLLDIVFVYDTTSVAMLPKSGPDWFAQKTALLSGLGKNIDVVSLQVPPATVIDPVTLPSKAGKAIAVYSFANYQAKDGQARSDITAYRHAVVWLAATQITVTEQ
jgi:type VI secretion system protein